MTVKCKHLGVVKLAFSHSQFLGVRLRGELYTNIVKEIHFKCKLKEQINEVTEKF